MKSANLLFFFSFFAVSVYVLNTSVPFVGNETTKNAEAADEGEKVTDVVCGMKIDKSGAKVVEVSGKSFYFCSDKCKVKFEENPGKVACMCFVGLEEGDEPCDCPHCSGEGVKCDCAEHHGDHHEHGHEHGEHEHSL